MAKAKSLLECLGEDALSRGADSITVECKNGREYVFAAVEGRSHRIADFPSKGAEAEELRSNLLSAARKPLRTLLGGQACLLTVVAVDRFGEHPFEVRIDPLPKLDLSAAPSFTPKQGQYLAFIHNYTKICRQAPAEADFERHFSVSAPSVHEMIKTLQRKGLIERTPGEARSIRLLVKPEHLPPLA